MMKAKFKDRDQPGSALGASKGKGTLTQQSEALETAGNSSGIFWGNPVETDPLSK